MSYDNLVVEIGDDFLADITLNRPEQLNTFNTPLAAELVHALNELDLETRVRVIIVKGAGKAFCAGHDLREMTEARQAEDGGAAAFKDLFDRCSGVMARIQSMPQPVIAQVHGIATAAGCQLVATCDMAVAAQGTRFGVNGVNIGLFCSTPMVALTRNIPRKQAFEMLTTGAFIDADRAETLGLVNRVVAPDTLASETADLAATVASKLGAAVKIGKSAFYDQLQMPVADAYAYTGEVMVRNMLHRDTQEGISAFLDKRDPSWNQ